MNKQKENSFNPFFPGVLSQGFWEFRPFYRTEKYELTATKF